MLLLGSHWHKMRNSQLKRQAKQFFKKLIRLRSGGHTPFSIRRPGELRPHEFLPPHLVKSQAHDAPSRACVSPP